MHTPSLAQVPDDGTSLDDLVLAAQVRELQRNVPSMVAATWLTALGVLHYFSPALPPGVDLSGWVGLMVALGVLRLAVLAVWRRDPQADRRPRPWAAWMLVLSAMTGLAWSLTATVYLPSAASGFCPAVAALLMGVSAAAVVSQAAHYRAFATFVTCLLVPALFGFGSRPGDLAWVITLMLAFFMILLLIGGKRSADANARTLRLQFELAALARAEEAARRAAEEANAAKNQFLMNMSHELRTPMHAVLAYAQLGIAKGRDERIRGYLQRIQISAGGLLVLLSDLLDLARLETGRMSFEMLAQDPASVVLETAEEFAPEAQRRDIALDLAVPPGLAQVRLDRVRMAQVVRNLLSNALKFSPAGSTIGVRLWSRGDAVRLAVQDQGVGIPEGELEAVFDKFVQSSKTRTGAGGTGLGLAICREIVGAHGGHIRALSPAQGGTCIEVELPTSAPAAADRAATGV